MIHSLKTKNIKRISRSAEHAAFTDLCENPFDGTSSSLLCVYREADTHVSPNGKIVLCEIDKKSMTSNTLKELQIPGSDLRDPKFSFDGECLFITAYAKTLLDNGSISRHMVSYSSTNGKTWSAPNHFGDDAWWIWNCDRYKSYFYGFAYNRAAESISLYRGNLDNSMHCYRENVFGLEKSGKGYPNESALLFDGQGNANVFLRRDADTFSAQFGFSQPPYSEWEWHDLGVYIGGPAAAKLENGNFLVAGRHVDWDSESFSTRLWHFDTKTKTLSELLTLPSSGDTSYPGLVINDDILYASYYSSHIDGQSRVYLAKLRGVKSLNITK